MRLIFTETTVITAEPQALTVAQLNHHLKELLDSTPQLKGLAVRGEVSNFRRQRGSGHCYFSLKDDAAQIRCCLWKFQVPRVNFVPSDGDRVIVHGKVDFYAKGGEISFIVDGIEFAGQGALWEAFLRLKEKLHGEGLFDEERKKPLPRFPRRIGVITSASGAVWHDITHVMERRWPLVSLLKIPATVQGSEAPSSLMAALSHAAQQQHLDLVIIARGGGSAEDLWCFNDEALARLVAEFPLPVISAVGHETDFTILDFVADHRAPTPSAAAEMAVPDGVEIMEHVRGLRSRALRQAGVSLERKCEKVRQLQQRARGAHPATRIRGEREKLNQLRQRLKSTFTHRLSTERQCISAFRATLRALSPTRVLERGYALVRDAENHLVTSAAQGAQQDALTLVFHDGEIRTNVRK